MGWWMNGWVDGRVTPDVPSGQLKLIRTLPCRGIGTVHPFCVPQIPAPRKSWSEYCDSGPI